MTSAAPGLFHRSIDEHIERGRDLSVADEHNRAHPDRGKLAAGLGHRRGRHAWATTAQCANLIRRLGDDLEAGSWKMRLGPARTVIAVAAPALRSCRVSLRA
jgi:hypothetical protein